MIDDARTQGGADVTAVGGQERMLPPYDYDIAWALLNASNELVLVVDLNERIVALNDDMAHLLGKTVPEIVGASVWDVLPPPIAQEKIRYGLEVVRTKQPLRFQDERDGRQFLNSMAPIFGSDGEVRYVAAFVRDITEVVRAEQEQRLASLGRLSAGVAHEFNNLMGALLLAARMVKNPLADCELSELVELIVSATNSGRDICHNLLTFARPSEQPVKVLPIEDAIEKALLLCLPRLVKAQVQVKKEFATEGSCVQGDSSQFAHVFLNLLLNACEATPGGGLLTIRTLHEPQPDGFGTVVVEVADTGHGVAPEDLPRLFEPFYTTKGPLEMSAVPGTGLGLSVCYGILEHHRGSIEVASTPGAGAVFTVRLPAVPAPAKEISPDDTAGATPAFSLRGRVLVAEDQPHMLQLLRRLLAVEGCEAFVTPLTDEALAALATQKFDLVISDYQMPGGGAPRILTELQRMDKAPPMIVITGSADPAATDRLLEQGAAACLLKPFELDDLRQLMARLLSP